MWRTSYLRPLLLPNFTHVSMVLQSIETFPNVVLTVRRHSSQTGQAYLAETNFGRAA